ncbi:MAG: hypothetical protein V1743_00320 [Nanoarchaeota archaeon]
MCSGVSYLPSCYLPSCPYTSTFSNIQLPIAKRMMVITPSTAKSSSRPKWLVHVLVPRMLN